MNGIIDKCGYSSTLDAKTKSDETLRVSFPCKDQVSANSVKKQMRDLSSKIGIDVQPIYTSKKLEQFQRIADHRYSAIGRHLRNAHGTIDLLNESQFTMLMYSILNVLKNNKTQLEHPERLH